ncbi:Pkinase-domain-containing protein [Coprinellus micaceus]|uniref:Pkinase-domain-containing protein n=1 Tax=Coprinellus micaceus TaxID=71717 RepID=A0A4Y7TLV0_COPMI|nr:Pkinase-domain-containing protein [Coprinellus micaceus]
MSSSANADDNLTWAVRPNSQLTDVEGLSDLMLGVRVGGRNQQAPSQLSALSKEYHSGGTGSDSDTIGPRRRKRSNTVSSVGYKPNLSKPTFQWMRGELLGRGSYGQVFLALNATTGELMAVKQVELPKTASDRANTHQLNVLKALKFESDTLSDLDHPNIVQYLGFEESTDNLSIFLEYVPGGSVSALLQAHGRLREEVVTSFLHQILDGLEYLHSKNIIHRDLKADNILVEPTGVCKISDFGISKKASDLHQGGRAHTMMRGTVYWMAPEVVNSNGGQGYDIKVDIWSVGCIALEMWSGRRPWSDLPMMPVMFKLFTEKSPPPVPDDIQLSALADAFRTECFYVDPQKRPHAHVLKKHAYLHLYNHTDWIFDMKDMAFSDKPPLPPPVQYSSPSHADQNRSARGVTTREGVSTIVPSRPAPRHPSTAKPSLTALKIPEYKPPHSPPKREPSRKGSQSDRSRRAALSPIRKQEAEGPRLVIITPPGSPKSKISEDAGGIGTYGLSSASAVAPPSRKGRARRYVVLNPDSESNTPSFVYTPPPLPDPNTTPSASSPNFKPSRLFEPETPTRSISTFVASGTSPPPLSSLPSSLPSAGSEPSPSPVPSSASTSMLRSPRPLPPSPAAPIPMPSTSISFKSAYPPPRYPLPPPSLPVSSSRHEGNTAYRSAHPQDHATTTIVNGKPVRRLPVISHARTLKTSTSVANLPATGSRALMKQKSVPDVSIFAFERPNTAHGSTAGSHNIRSFSLDSDPGHPPTAGQYHRRPSTAHSATPTRALPDPLKLAAQRSDKINGEQSPKKRDNRLTLRPRPEDVYEHLESWFPNHNLDQSLDIDGTTPLTPTPRSPQTEEGPSSKERKASNRKSIKMIVKEQVNRNRAEPWRLTRRQTRLWNSNVKELKG